jgi:riboflavin biosynthesis pyrimidine reductase
VRRLVASADEVDLAAAYAVDAERHVRANFVSSADGAVAVEGKSAPLGNDADRRLFQVLRSLADVVLVGAGTARKENYGGARSADDRSPPPIAVVSRSLDLDPAARLFTDTQVRPIVVTCAAAPHDQREGLSDVADLVVAGDAEVDLADALDQLARRGLRHVLCEGGPSLLGSLAQVGLLDELCLTLSPVLAGGDAGRIIAGYHPRAVGSMHLRHALVDGDHLFLRYSTAAA